MASLQLSAAREFCFKIPVYASRPCPLFGEDGHACSKDKGHDGKDHYCDCGYEWTEDGLTFTTSNMAAAVNFQPELKWMQGSILAEALLASALTMDQVLHGSPRCTARQRH